MPSQNPLAAPITPVTPPTNEPPDVEQKKLIRAVRSGFALVLTLTLVLGGMGLYQLNGINASMSKIVRVNNTKIALASSMRDAIRLRAMAINEMLATDDYFKRDSELMKFYDYARVYREARDQLLALGVHGREKAIIDRLTEQARITQPLVRQTAELLMEKTLPADFNQHLIEATHKQEVLFELLDQSIELQKEFANHALSAARIEFEYIVVLSAAVLAVLLTIGAIVARIVVRYVGGKNTMLALKNTELQIARAKADEATRAKSEFLANMSHEIRTPLTAVLGFSESLVDDDLSADERQRAVQAIRNSGKHLYDIINDVLDISKIEAGKLEMETMAVSPLDVVKDTVCIMGNTAANRGLQLNIEYDLPLPQVIVTDALRLKQILLNLCANAVKFTETGGITIRLGYSAQTRRMRFSVRDTGIGMTPQQVEKVFLPFQQAEKSTKRFYGGTGLGLSISKQLAQRLGGDLKCHSEIGKGTEFTVTVYAGEQEPSLWINDPPALTELRPPVVLSNTIPQLHGRVLLAEDSADIRAMITMYLQKAGIEVMAVTNGEEAVQEAVRGHFDLMLMDMKMPVMDGLDAIRRMRTHGIDSPIVVLTANATREDKHRCLNAGADNFLVKPIEMELFNEMLLQYLGAPEHAGGISGDEATTVDSTPVEDEDFERQMQQLTQAFLKGLPATVDEITTYYSGGNWRELLDSTHRLKGAGGAFGYPELSEISRKIMEQVKRRDHGELRELIDRLNQRCRQITRKAG